MNPPKYKFIFFNSVLLFVTAFILEITLHESGHFIPAWLFHAKNLVLGHNYVDYTGEGLSFTHKLIICAGGPLVSLAIGTLFHFICLRYPRRDMWFLFCLYLSIFGYIGFLGYLQISPFFTYGDTGAIFHALRFPLWLVITIAGGSVAVTYLLFRRLVPLFLQLANPAMVETKAGRAGFLKYILLFPFLPAVVISTLLNLPAPTFLSLLYPLCSPFIILWPYEEVLHRNYPATGKTPDETSSIEKIQPWWIAVFILVVILNRWLAILGLSISI